MVARHILAKDKADLRVEIRVEQQFDGDPDFAKVQLWFSRPGEDGSLYLWKDLGFWKRRSDDRQMWFEASHGPFKAQASTPDDCVRVVKEYLLGLSLSREVALERSYNSL